MALNNKAAEAKYNVSLDIDGSLGVLVNASSETIPCHVETQLRVEVVGVGPTNEIQIYGRIRNSELWHYIATVTGAVTGLADISTYDFIRYFHTVADGTGKLSASGFIFSSGGGNGGGSATSANQVIGNNYLSSINNTLSDKSFRFDNTIATTLYLGEAVIGSSDSSAVWKIKRVDISGTLISIKYASSNYDQIWNNRASLTYV